MTIPVEADSLQEGASCLPPMTTIAQNRPVLRGRQTRLVQIYQS